MGRHQKITLIYGIKIDEDTAKKIYEYEYDQEKQDFKEDFPDYRKYLGKYYPNMWADGINASVQNRFYEENFQHYFGIRMEDDADSMPNKVPIKALESYNLCIKPVMKKYGLKNKPKMYFISQIV